MRSIILTDSSNSPVKQEKRYFIQAVITKKGTVMQQWTINDREAMNSTVVRIYYVESFVQKICDLLNKEDGYLD